MKLRILTRAAAVSLALVCAAPARATTFNFSYSLPTGDTDVFPSGYSSASGQFVATDEGGGTYLVTAVSGLWNGQMITGLEPTGSEGGNDNLIFPSSDPVLDSSGVTFSVSGAIAGDTGTYQVHIYSFLGPPVSYADDGEFTDSTPTFNLSVAGVPEPGAWALMLVGMGAIGATVRARRRAVVASI